MITTSDIGNILYRDCKAFGIRITPYGKKLVGVQTERVIVIHVKELQGEKYMRKVFVEVNILVPDITTDEPDKAALEEMEEMAYSLLDGVSGSHKGLIYEYSVYSTSSDNPDKEKECHYVNVKVLFKFPNVK